MPNFANYNQTEAKFSEGFKQLEPGHYPLRILAVRTEWTEREYQTGIDKACSTANDAAVLFIFDIAGGEFAGNFTKDFFMAGGQLDQRKDFMHQYKFTWGDLSNANDAARAKWTLDHITASNPGFDALAAFQADQWQLFVGKCFGAVLNGTVKTNDRGYDQWTLRPAAKIYTVTEVANGQYMDSDGEMKPLPEPRITDRRTKVAAESSTASGGQAEQVPAEIYDDLPFV